MPRPAQMRYRMTIARDSWGTRLRILALAVAAIALTACVPAASPTPAITVTTTATVTATPRATPSSPDEEGLRRDADLVVTVVCEVSTAYANFVEVIDRLRGNQSSLPKAKKAAEDVVFALDAMQGRLTIGPEGGWSDSNFGLNMLQIAYMIGANQPVFTSATQASSATDMLSLYEGVLSNPVAPEDVSLFMQYLPPEQAEAIGVCAQP
jgi:hypothetical protein